MSDAVHRHIASAPSLREGNPGLLASSLFSSLPAAWPSSLLAISHLGCHSWVYTWIAEHNRACPVSLSCGPADSSPIGPKETVLTPTEGVQYLKMKACIGDENTNSKWALTEDAEQGPARSLYLIRRPGERRPQSVPHLESKKVPSRSVPL